MAEKVTAYRSKSGKLFSTQSEAESDDDRHHADEWFAKEGYKVRWIEDLNGLAAYLHKNDYWLRVVSLLDSEGVL
jgi:hypothetical protein